MGTHSISYSGDLNHKLQMIRDWASKYNIMFQGNTERGSFDGRGLSGSYYREGQFIIVTITSVPVLMSEQNIVNQMAGFLR